MANRRITELSPISGSELQGPDLLTLVHVIEVDPTLKNKKITLDEFKEYLLQSFAKTFSGIQTYADNSSAIAGGLLPGEVYRKADGTLMIVF